MKKIPVKIIFYLALLPLLLYSCKEDLSPENEILSFEIGSTDGFIDEDNKTVTIKLAQGTDISSLTPDIYVSPKAEYQPKEAQDFTHPVVYTVTAENGDKASYTATVELFDHTIYSFRFAEHKPKVKEVISDGHITVTVPFYANIKRLTPIVEIPDGATIEPGTGIPTDFTNPVEYILTSKNGLIKTRYTVNIEKTSMQITSVNKTAVAIGDTIIIRGNFAPSENRVYIGSSVCMSNTQTDSCLREVVRSDYYKPELGENTLSVRNEWGIITYPHKITILPARRQITSFRIKHGSTWYTTNISELSKTIKTHLPYGVDITNLVPEIKVSPGAKITPPSGVRTDFTNPVEYVVTANDGSTMTYTANIIGTPRFVIDNVENTTLELGENIVLHGTFCREGNEVFLRKISTNEYQPLPINSQNQTTISCHAAGYFEAGEYRLSVGKIQNGNEAVYPVNITLLESPILPRITGLNKTEFKAGEILTIQGIRFPIGKPYIVKYSTKYSYGAQCKGNTISVPVPDSYTKGEYTVYVEFQQPYLHTNKVAIKVID